ncbi:MAG: prepilin-type N-terminal cleavage/methylation domain-containing protein [Aquabacterium sp.]|nr:prepilin-type N-terminal cleavage/methylation domain-containing protein [Aquabacterium sp.]
MAHPHRPAGRQCGVSLVEALVALAIMSIGMLALVGVQSTMRLNSDLAKQRTEATRIASEEIERVRSFISMGAVNGQPGVSYDEIVDRVVENYQPPDGIGNTTYRVVRNVRDLPGSAQKVVWVRVQWTDRSNLPQTVTLDSAVNGTAPTLGAMLVVPHRDSATSRNRGRHVSIPEGAVDRGDGSSLFVPPGATGLGWYFNNLTGVMRVCTGVVINYATCPLATLVSGVVLYHDSDTQPTAADAENPQGSVFALATGPRAMELADAVGSGLSASCYAATEITRAVYFCAIITSDTAGWGGQLNPMPVSGGGAALTFGVLASSYKSCRYTTDLPTAEDPNTIAIEADPHAQFTANASHPRKYCLERPRNTNEAGLACTGKRVKENLINQNFLIIRGNQTCPTELNDDGSPKTGTDAGLDPLILANTRQHQPTP